MSFLVLLQCEQFYPDGLFCVFSFPLQFSLNYLMKLKLIAPKFKDFPAPAAIFKEFQGFKDFQGAFEPCTLQLKIWY